MFPSGFVDFGEHPKEALARELLEETGLTMTSARLLGVFQSPDDFREPGHFVFFYRAGVLPGNLRTDTHEKSCTESSLRTCTEDFIAMSLDPNSRIQMPMIAFYVS
jgi:8-oxo-dGTP diphosphatase